MKKSHSATGWPIPVETNGAGSLRGAGNVVEALRADRVQNLGEVFDKTGISKTSTLPPPTHTHSSATTSGMQVTRTIPQTSSKNCSLDHEQKCIEALHKYFPWRTALHGR